MHQSVSRKRSSSANRRKAVARLGVYYRRMAATRHDFLHRETTKLVSTHALIAIENLAVRAMTASAAGTTDAPGKNVRAKAGLNRTILRNGWSMARSMLEYKAAWRGVALVAVPPSFTSQTCSACGETVAESRKTQALFQCITCGHTENADRNAAKNILRRAQRQLGEGFCATRSSGEARPVPRDTRELMPVRAHVPSNNALGRAQRLEEVQ
jgi:putative transposase